MVSVAEVLDCTSQEPLPVLDRSGNTHCYNCIIESMQTQAYNLARRMLDDWSLAEDAVQESFVSGYRAFHQFRGDNLNAWVMRIVANTCRDMLRSRKARPTISLDPISSDPDDPTAPLRQPTSIHRRVSGRPHSSGGTGPDNPSGPGIHSPKSSG